MRIYTFILCVFLLVFLFSCDKKTNPTTPEIQEDTVIPETTKPIAADDWQANLITTSEDGFIFYLNADFSKKNQFSPGDIIVSDYGEGFLRKIISVNTTSEVVALITENAALVEAVTNGSVSFVEPLVLEKEAHLQKEGGSYYNILRKNGPDNITGIEYSFQEILFDSDGDYLTTLDQVIVSGVYEITPIIYGDLEISQGQLKRFSLNYAVNEKLQITGKVNVPVTQSTSVALEPVLFAPIVVYLDTVPVKLTPELTFIVGADLSVDAAMQSSLNQDLTYALGLVYEEKIWKMESNLQKTFAYEPPTVSRSLHGTFYLKPAFQIKVWDTVSPRLDAELYSELIANPQNNPGVELFAGYDFGIDIGMSIFDYAVLDYQAAVFTDKIQLWHLDALPNIAPTASFTISPTSGTTATTFQFDASGSTDNEDSSSELQVRWDWENDGNWDTDYSTDKIASHQYGSDGTKTILLEVKDSGGLTKTATKQVTVSLDNTAPTASFTVSPTSGTTETTFQFDASGSSDSEDDISALQVRWDWENDGTWDTDYSTSKTASHQYGSEGTKTVRLEVRDSGGLTKTATKQVTVSLDNTAPTASFIVSPTSGTTETTFQFDGSGSSDNEDDSSVLQVRWDWENDGTWDTDYSTSKTASHQYGSDGTKTILLEVRDSGGLTNTTNKQVAVSSANTVPTASFTISPTSGTTETTFQFDATSSSDNEDDSSVLQVRWDWENDGAWDTDYSTSKTASHQYGSEGTKTVRLEVRDNGGLTKTATKQVTVSLDNTAPTASFTVSPTSGTTETTFQFDASGSSDSEDDISALQVRWDWENDGSWDTDYSTSKTASLQYGSEGTRTILLEVKDSGGLTNTTTKQVTVSSANTAPVASFIISPTSGTTETTFQFDASGSSDNEDATSALQVRWDWENDGTWDTNFSTGKITSHQYSSEGTKTILLEVKDSGGLTNTTTRQVVVSPANTEPTASFTIFPLSGTTESNFQFDASGSSDNEDVTSVLQVRWDWENDGNWDTDYSTTKTALHMFSSAGTKTVLLEVRDSGGLTNNTTKQVEVITASPGETGTVTDIDGNVYKTVKIGNQWWMAENLKVTRFNNGDSIPIVSDDVAWTNTGIAYCIYDNDTRNIDNYGFLYKFWALNHNNRTIAPQGWHIPTNNDWQTLVDYLGGEAIAGSSMKEEGTVHWAEPNEGATNSSGFTALPGGYRKYTGAFGSINTRAYFWSSEMRDIYTALYQTLHTINASILLGNTIDPGYGFSVRCVKD